MHTLSSALKLSSLLTKLKISDNSGTGPDKGIVALIPVHAAINLAKLAGGMASDSQSLTPGEAWMGCPGSSERDVVFSVKEVGCFMSEDVQVELIVTHQYIPGIIPSLQNHHVPSTQS